MKVTPVARKFGKYSPGDAFDLPDRVAKVFIKAKKVQEVGMTYQTRMLQAKNPEFDAMVAKGRKAWADVPDASEWVEEQRGNVTAGVLDVDSSGAAWDAALHTGTKLKNADGTWRKKPGRVAG